MFVYYGFDIIKKIDEENYQKKTNKNQSKSIPNSHPHIKKVGTYKQGESLPKNGACSHYKHSYRFFRFPCCGKAFPCDICHD